MRNTKHYLIDAEKTFDKTQHAFMLKILKQIGNGRIVPQHKEKPNASISLNGKKVAQSHH